MLPPCPLTAAELESWRVRARRWLRPGLVGAHRSRRKGQSLEFRDFQAYQPGDDIRHVDWAASARNRRLPGEAPFQHWLVRTFVAEDDLHLVVTLDTRSTLLLPAPLPKAHVAAWLAESLSRIALLQRERVTLHRLAGGRPAESLLPLPAAALDGLSDRLRTWLGDERVNDGTMHLTRLHRLLPPTAVWVVISDFYFTPEEPAARLIEQMVRAQSAYRWVLAVELDSWPHERLAIGTGPRALAPTPWTMGERQRVEITEAALAKVGQRIERNVSAHRQRLAAGGVDYTVWRWPERREIADAAHEFRTLFFGDKVLRRIFERDA